MNDVDAVVAGVGHVVDAHLCPDVRDAPSSSTVESIKQSMIFCRVYKKQPQGEPLRWGGDPCPLRNSKFLSGTK